jgi:hypothetical protein
MDSSTLLVVAAVAIAIMGAVWFGLRFWIASTRPADIKEVDTPTIDRLNREALERGRGDEDDEGEENEEDEKDGEELANDEGDDGEEETMEGDDDEPPEALKEVVPENPTK